MKEITSRSFKDQGLAKTQIITDEDWNWIVAQGWQNKYDVVDMPEKKLKTVPSVEGEKPIELKTKTKKQG